MVEVLVMLTRSWLAYCTTWRHRSESVYMHACSELASMHCMWCKVLNVSAIECVKNQCLLIDRYLRKALFPMHPDLKLVGEYRAIYIVTVALLDLMDSTIKIKSFG